MSTLDREGWREGRWDGFHEGVFLYRVLVRREEPQSLIRACRVGPSTRVSASPSPFQLPIPFLFRPWAREGSGAIGGGGWDVGPSLGKFNIRPPS